MPSAKPDGATCSRKRDRGRAAAAADIDDPLARLWPGAIDQKIGETGASSTSCIGCRSVQR